MSSPTGRIIGLDVARAVAIIGMIVAHIYPAEWHSSGDAGVRSWVAELSSGYPSTLFAVLVGCSTVLMLPTAGRLQLLVRGALLGVAGVALDTVQSHIAVVLVPLGVSMVVLSLVLAWRPRYQVLLGVVLLLGNQLVTAVVFAGAMFGAVNAYPVPVWVVYGLVGSWYIRTRTSRWWWVAVPAAAVCLAARPWLQQWGVAWPHSGTPDDVLLTATVAVGVIVCCEQLGRAAVRWRAAGVSLLPVQRMGQMALTVYVVHVLVTGIGLGILDDRAAVSPPEPAVVESTVDEETILRELQDAAARATSVQEVLDAAYRADDELLGRPVPGWDSVPEPEEFPAWMLPGQILVFLTFATVWLAHHRRGPLEELLARAQRRGAEILLAA
ncbi:heparan-alpha-glucosaminide N-acetyltransferase domain-containing protein [Corynebacterium sp. 13CS0277]|uniref:heparan-alpha-glucosaminide N-acetyltransferase domain-containing protein n=1 Tax=Corynebacterium sp. 13CS0277 TaxID=2071994 RepID=UPI00130491DC|nr:heparan-alpha-glucosaminide N-acetyltransferase domain-containing protein [Corynebacterium sp. 13CS0277]